MQSYGFSDDNLSWTQRNRLDPIAESFLEESLIIFGADRAGSVVSNFKGDEIYIPLLGVVSCPCQAAERFLETISRVRPYIKGRWPISCRKQYLSLMALVTFLCVVTSIAIGCGECGWLP